MIYSSLIFIYAFLPLSLLIHKLTPEKHKELVLLVLSLVFISFSGLGALVLLVFFTLLNFSGGLLIQRTRDAKGIPGLPLAGILAADAVIVFIMRSDTLSRAGGRIGFDGFLYPLGFSLIALSAAGYLMDICFGRQRTEKDIIRFSLFLLMFPKLIMGPVLTYRHYSRLREKRSQSMEVLGEGLTIFIKGLAKKVIAADNLYMLYQAVNGMKIKDLSAVTAWIGALAYVLCLYFTLSGVADMGAGAARCFGYRIPDSFRYPLFSSKLGYFGKKWHLQLVRWFIRYVERPLSSLTSHKWLRSMIFISTCGLIGFWYRFNANGFICGLVFGALLLVERRLSGFKIMKMTGVLYTAIILLLLGTFFSGNSVSVAMRSIGAMTGSSRTLADALSVYLIRSYSVLLLVCMYASSDLFRTTLIRTANTKLRSFMTGAKPVLMLLLLIACTAFMSYSGSSEMLLVRL